MRGQATKRRTAAAAAAAPAEKEALSSDRTKRQRIDGGAVERAIPDDGAAATAVGGDWKHRGKKRNIKDQQRKGRNNNAAKGYTPQFNLVSPKFNTYYHAQNLFATRKSAGGSASGTGHLGSNHPDRTKPAVAAAAAEYTARVDAAMNSSSSTLHAAAAAHETKVAASALCTDPGATHAQQDSEWNSFLAALREKLPSTFRVSRGHGLDHAVNARIRALAEELHSVVGTPDMMLPGTDTPIGAPRPLSWFPGQLGWQIDVNRKDMRKVPGLTNFRTMLVAQNNEGAIARQEAVSMVPPLVLGVEPHHFVLDMCAAPGSKTAQLLEDIYAPGATMHTVAAGQERAPRTGPFTVRPLPTGAIIANDSEPRRAHMLVHQLKRLNMPSYAVSCHDGQDFPSLYLPESHPRAQMEIRRCAAAKAAAAGSSTASAASVSRVVYASKRKIEAGLSSRVQQGDVSAPHRPAATERQVHIPFDRILCDVPCSGDGTMRKAPDLWARWTPRLGMGLHMTQIRIAWRGLQLLAADGMMVYSTCSLNPIENEAVVAQLLRRGGDSVELVDIEDRLPGLVRRAGLTTWCLLDSAMEEVAKDDPRLLAGKDAATRTVVGPKGKTRKSLLTQSMLPPTEEECTKFHLERCMRILPHDNNTGGFFVALLKKKSRLSGEAVVQNNDEPGQGTTETLQAEVSAAACDSVASAAATEAKAVRTPITPAPVAATASSAPKAKAEKRPKRGFVEDPFVPFGDKNAARILSHFGMSTNVPSIASDALYIRASQQGGTDGNDASNKSTDENAAYSKVYLLSPLNGAILTCPANDRLKLVHSGLRAFERDRATLSSRKRQAVALIGSAVGERRSTSAAAQESTDLPPVLSHRRYRMGQEVVGWFLPYVNGQVLEVDLPVYERIMLSNGEDGVKVTSLSSPDVERQFSSMKCGSALMLTRGEDVAQRTGGRVWLISAVDVGSDALRPMVSKPERAALRLMLAGR